MPMGRPSSFNQLPYDSEHYSLPHMFLQHTMEQDRASPVLSHHAELAWAAADQPNGDHRIDRGDDDETGLTVRCELDENTYARGVKVSDAEMAALYISGDAFHPEWNYTIAPRSMPAST